MTTTAATAGGELSAMTVLALRQNAQALGCRANEIEEARDGNDPKGELIALIQEHMARSPPPVDLAAMKVELAQKSVGELRKQAASSGVADDQIEHARDSGDPKAALIDLITAKVAIP
jgi:hypothetical protein